MAISRGLAARTVSIILIGLAAACTAPSPETEKAPPPPSVAGAVRAERANPGSPVDLNTATRGELIALPGIGEAYADRIIAGRPYKRKDQLLSMGIVPEGVYRKFADRVVARQP